MAVERIALQMNHASKPEGSSSLPNATEHSDTDCMTSDEWRYRYPDMALSSEDSDWDFGRSISSSSDNEAYL